MYLRRSFESNFTAKSSIEFPFFLVLSIVDWIFLNIIVITKYRTEYQRQVKLFYNIRILYILVGA